MELKDLEDYENTSVSNCIWIDSCIALYVKHVYANCTHLLLLRRKQSLYVQHSWTVIRCTENHDIALFSIVVYRLPRYYWFLQIVQLDVKDRWMKYLGLNDLFHRWYKWCRKIHMAVCQLIQYLTILKSRNQWKTSSKQINNEGNQSCSKHFVNIYWHRFA